MHIHEYEKVSNNTFEQFCRRVEQDFTSLLIFDDYKEKIDINLQQHDLHLRDIRKNALNFERKQVDVNNNQNEALVTTNSTLDEH